MRNFIIIFTSLFVGSGALAKDKSPVVPERLTGVQLVSPQEARDQVYAEDFNVKKTASS